MKTPTKPEIFLGLVGPLGSSLTDLEACIATALESILGYNCGRISLSDRLTYFNYRLWQQVWSGFDDVPGHARRWWSYSGDMTAPPTKGTPEHVRIKALMDAGKIVREGVGQPDTLVRLALGEVISQRKTAPVAEPFACVFRSLKHPHELETLRSCYGQSFILVGASSLPERRRSRLEALISRSSALKPDEISRVAEYLIDRDSFEHDHGQRVRDIFYLADHFIDMDQPPSEWQAETERFLRLLFRDRSITPKKEEYAMHIAHGAASRSGSLGRQVGAAVIDNAGEAVALGCNELAKPGGGLVFSDDKRWAPMRDIAAGVDSAYHETRILLGEMSERLGDVGDENAVRSALKGTRVLSLIEFYREVHAEAAALLDAARRGVAVRGYTLVVTTFPCHDCAKQIIAAGIRTVVYLEPYPKSRALHFFREAITLDPTCPAGRVLFRPYVGAGPRIYADVFCTTTTSGASRDRKDETGLLAAWIPEFAWRPCYYENIEKSTFVDGIDQIAINAPELWPRDLQRPT